MKAAALAGASAPRNTFNLKSDAFAKSWAGLLNYPTGGFTRLPSDPSWGSPTKKGDLWIAPKHVGQIFAYSSYSKSFQPRNQFILSNYTQICGGSKKSARDYVKSAASLPTPYSETCLLLGVLLSLLFNIMIIMYKAWVFARKTDKSHFSRSPHQWICWALGHIHSFDAYPNQLNSLHFSLSLRKKCQFPLQACLDWASFFVHTF